MRYDIETPGQKLFAGKSYGFEEILTHLKKGDNRLRTERLAQPSALRKGDILASRENITSSPRKDKEGNIFIKISKGLEDGNWIKLPPSIPIALQSPKNRGKGKFARAINLEKGSILATGVKLLDNPYVIEGASVSLKLSGEDYTHRVRLLSNVPVALLTRFDSAPKELWSL